MVEFQSTPARGRQLQALGFGLADQGFNPRPRAGDNGGHSNYLRTSYLQLSRRGPRHSSMRTSGLRCALRLQPAHFQRFLA